MMVEDPEQGGVGYFAFVAAAIFFFVWFIAIAADPAWEITGNYLYDLGSFETTEKKMFMIGMALATIALAAFALKLASRTDSTLKSLAGTMILLSMVISLSLTIAGVPEELGEILLNAFEISALISMVLLIADSISDGRVIAGGFTLILFSAIVGHLYFDGLELGANVSILAFGIALVIQNFSILLEKENTVWC